MFCHPQEVRPKRSTTLFVVVQFLNGFLRSYFPKWRSKTRLWKIFGQSQAGDTDFFLATLFFFSMQPVLLFVVALLLSVDCSLPPDQKNSLIDLYDATGGAFWTTKWNISTDDPCDPPWFGVACDSLNLNVVDLDLPQNNLVGSLPDLLLPALSSM